MGLSLIVGILAIIACAYMRLEWPIAKWVGIMAFAGVYVYLSNKKLW